MAHFNQKACEGELHKYDHIHLHYYLMKIHKSSKNGFRKLYIPLNN